ncbi:MAG: patatin family protein [Oscillospiraceae bacterium]|nr:patatin family protein [Oscillospiraceae bacterium]
MKTGLILEGGAIRGIFTAGVLDRLMENGIYLPYVIGVSAGGGNAMSYRSRQTGRTCRLMTAPKEESYYGLHQFWESKKIINLDKMCYEYPYKQFPFDFNTYFGSDIVTEYACTCCETGEAEYLSEPCDERRLLTICKATCSIPMLCEPVEFDGKHYLDGSIADSIPIERALEMGCDKVVIVLTKPEGNVAPTDYRKFKGVINAMYKDYPAFVEACMTRVERYEKNKQLMEKMQRDGTAYIIRPETTPVSKFEKDMKKVLDFYRHGYTLMDSRFIDFLKWNETIPVNI